MKRLGFTLLLLLLIAPGSLTGARAASSGVRSKAPARQATSMVLPFIEDDYPKALARARASGVPLFIDAWAPW